MLQQQVVDLAGDLASVQALLSSLRKYESNFTPEAKATVQRANASVVSATAIVAALPQCRGIAGWLLTGKPRTHLRELRAGNQLVLNSLTALFAGGIPLPRSTKVSYRLIASMLEQRLQPFVRFRSQEELTQLKTKLQAWKLIGTEQQEQLATRLQQLYAEVTGQSGPVDVDAVEQKVDSVMRSVLLSVCGSQDLPPEELEQELGLLEQAVSSDQNVEGNATMLSLALNSLQRLHASQIGGDEGDDSDEEDVIEEEDEDDPFYMPLPSAALKWADEKKFKLLAMPISSDADAASKPMLELADEPCTPERRALEVNVHATPGITAADYEPIPLNLQAPRAQSMNGQATTPSLSPSSGRQGGASHGSLREETAALAAPGHTEDAARAGDAVSCSATDGQHSHKEASSTQSSKMHEAVDAFADVNIHQPAVTAPAGETASSQAKSLPKAGNEDSKSLQQHVEQPASRESTAGLADPDATLAAPADEKQKQFVEFLQASALGKALSYNPKLCGANPGACMFHAQMRLSLDGCRKLAAFLANSSRVRALSLSHNYLGDDGMEIICNGLMQNSSVTSIDLPDNNISDNGCIMLASAIKHNMSLTQLQLSHNKIGDNGAIALAALISSSQSLKKLGLSNNNIGKAGCQAMTEAIRVNQTLKQLQLLPGNAGFSFNSYAEVTGQSGPVDVDAVEQKVDSVMRSVLLSVCGSQDLPPEVSRSMVVDAKTGSSKLDDIRTSYGAAFGRGEDVVIAEIEARIAEWTHLPPELGEPIQVPSPAQPSPAQPSPAQPSPAQPSPAQPSPAQPSPAQLSSTLPSTAPFLTAPSPYLNDCWCACGSALGHVLLQVLRYQNGQQYGAHWDWFDDPVHQAQYLQNGNRYATVLLYLSEVEEGGETTLPLATALDEAAQTLDNPSLCASRMGIAIKPVKGDALLFFDMNIQATKGDRFALHASCPTLKARPLAGTATDACWVVAASVGDMGSYDAAQQGGRCADTGSNCAAKAKEGACETEAETLMGPAGTCRRTCKDCVPCPSGDILCYRRNMRGSRSATLPGSRPV
ncbi:hypothetical protein QJQ45_021435 [Haematococcus lacustris]|nr:hypothetical protein QJQ45_021435 [Haematococcus lacustris]